MRPVFPVGDSIPAMATSTIDSVVDLQEDDRKLNRAMFLDVDRASSGKVRVPRPEPLREQASYVVEVVEGVRVEITTHGRSRNECLLIARLWRLTGAPS